MQTPIEVLNIGADVAKDEIVMACSQGSFPARKLANQRTSLLAFLKGRPAGSRIGMESTGTYHELFANVAHKLGFAVQTDGSNSLGSISEVICAVVNAFVLIITPSALGPIGNN